MSRTLLLLSISLALTVIAVPPAAAANSCAAPLGGGTTANCSFCDTGERLVIVVTGVLASGTVSGCGQFASCSTGLTLSCTATSGPITQSFTGDYSCSVSTGAIASCTSA